MVKSKKSTVVKPKVKAAAPVKKAIAPAVKAGVAMPAPKLVVPVFVNVKELRKWVAEQKKAQKTYDESEVSKQLAQLLQPKVI